MLFWIWLILFIIGFIIALIDGWEEFGAGTSAFSVFCLLVAGIVLIFCHIGVNGRVAKLQARYDSLVYQYENNIYDNDNDLGKRELMEDIQRWNEDLSANQKNQRDFWIGIYIPNVYDQFEYIELK